MLERRTTRLTRTRNLKSNLNSEQPTTDRVERLLTAYDAGCRSASQARRFDEQRGRELAMAAGFTSREELNCFLAALRNHC